MQGTRLKPVMFGLRQKERSVSVLQLLCRASKQSQSPGYTRFSAAGSHAVSHVKAKHMAQESAVPLGAHFSCALEALMLCVGRGISIIQLVDADTRS